MNYSGGISDICEPTAKSDLIRARKWHSGPCGWALHTGEERARREAPPLQCTCLGLNWVHTSSKTENKAEASCWPSRALLLVFSRWIPAWKAPQCQQRVHLGKMGGSKCLKKLPRLEPLQTQPACFAPPVGEQHHFQRLLYCQRPRAAGDQCERRAESENWFYCNYTMCKRLLP